MAIEQEKPMDKKSNRISTMERMQQSKEQFPRRRIRLIGFLCLLFVWSSYTNNAFVEAFVIGGKNSFSKNPRIFHNHENQVLASSSLTVVAPSYPKRTAATTRPTTTSTAIFSTTSSPPASTTASSTVSNEQERARQKQFLLGVLNPQPVQESVLADPKTKEPLQVTRKVGTLFAGGGAGAPGGGRMMKRPVTYEMQAKKKNGDGGGDIYTGSAETYLNLLEPATNTNEPRNNNNNGEYDKNPNSNQQNNNDNNKARRQTLVRNLTPFIPPPLRSALATAGVLVDTDYVPMRDLFTSPTVSYAYERGWRQSFRNAGFPGEEREAQMAMEYFAPAVATSTSKVLVDMSCATGLFTRRFAQSGNYHRVIGCDYSESMLLEARRRIQMDPSLSSSSSSNAKSTQLDLVRLDVGQIPMQNNSVDVLHAGAAMHCWPDLPAAVSEIYRVLKPNGGRYFATTFLSEYFRVLNQSEGGNTGPSRQAFQYFESIQQLKQLLVEHGGFEPTKVQIEILAPSCVVIRCEK